MFGMAHGLWTLLLLLAFVGIVVWAFSARRREAFERHARSVLDQDARGEVDQQPGEDDRG